MRYVRLRWAAWRSRLRLQILSMAEEVTQHSVQDSRCAIDGVEHEEYGFGGRHRKCGNWMHEDPIAPVAGEDVADGIGEVFLIHASVIAPPNVHHLVEHPML